MAFDGLHARAAHAAEPPRGRLYAAGLRARHPDEPWRWRPEWASGVIRCSHARTAIFAWGAALVWNLLSAPLLSAIPEELADGNRLAAIGLLFPVIGFGLLIVAIRETLRWRRFGRPDLVLDTFPGGIGGRFAGTVQLAASVGTDGAFEATLSCVRIRISGTGKNRSRRETLIWQDEQRLDASSCQVGPRGTAVPVVFSIPAGPEPSSPEPGRDVVEWRLDVGAAIPGIDYQARFVAATFGAFAVLLIWGALRECFRSVRVEATPEGVTIRSRTLLWPGRHRIAAGDIERIEAALRGHQNLRARYDILVHTTGDRHHSAGEGIADKREAEWLAGEIAAAVRGESAANRRPSA